MFTPRHAGLYIAVAGLAISALAALVGHASPLWALGFFGLALLGAHDLLQTRRSVLRNYPVLGHFRFMFESIRPELRQYIVESETEEIPFSRAQRSVVYQRAKNAMDSRAFGTELKVKEAGHSSNCCRRRLMGYYSCWTRQTGHESPQAIAMGQHGV